ncbi:hypothetical protein [Sphingopyxis sp. QXT-31]|nr:hypothetical protein [Sphingopyxis sp. QXT-31]
MKLWRQDWVALALFAVVAIGGLWLWTGEGPVVWLSDFAVMCGFF